MEQEKTSALNKIPEETKELNTKEDVVSRGDTLRPRYNLSNPGHEPYFCGCLRKYTSGFFYCSRLLASPPVHVKSLSCS
jgi:hypothetical protein